MNRDDWLCMRESTEQKLPITPASLHRIQLKRDLQPNLKVLEPWSQECAGKDRTEVTLI